MARSLTFNFGNFEEPITVLVPESPSFTRGQARAYLRSQAKKPGRTLAIEGCQKSGLSIAEAADVIQKLTRLRNRQRWLLKHAQVIAGDAYWEPDFPESADWCGIWSFPGGASLAGEPPA